jgi:hypothetical protein
MRKRAIARGGLLELDAQVESRLEALYGIEKSRPMSVDAPADVFGELLADIISYGYEGAEQRIARTIGRHVGRWIYIADALDDLDDDVKKGKYNPIVCLFGQTPSEAQKQMISDALKNELCDAERAFDLLDYHDNELLCGIIKNIIYLGMPKTVENIQNKTDKDDHGGKDSLKQDERSI